MTVVLHKSFGTGQLEKVVGSLAEVFWASSETSFIVPINEITVVNKEKRYSVWEFFTDGERIQSNTNSLAYAKKVLEKLANKPAIYAWVHDNLLGKRIDYA